MNSKSWSIRTKLNKGAWIELTLPVLIGSRADSDIVINSPAVPAHSKVLDVAHGELVCWDVQRNAYIEDYDLSAYGIKIQGPFPTGANVMERSFRRIQQKEESLLTRLPLWLQDVFGAHLPLGRRWMWRSLGMCGVMLAAFSWITLYKAPLHDASQLPIDLEYGHVQDMNLGLLNDVQNYRHGFTLRFAIPKESRNRDHVLEFMLGGADKPNEVEVIVSSKSLFASSVKTECIDELCAESVRVPKEFTKNDHVTITFVHRYRTSSYLVSRILFGQLRPLSDQERLTATRRLNAAQRYYDERAVSYQNLISGRKVVLQLLDLIRLRADADDIRVAAQALKEDFDAEIAVQTEDMWFQSRRAIKLAEYKTATQLLKALRQFYPDPEHPRSLQITSALKQLESTL